MFRVLADLPNGLDLVAGPVADNVRPDDRYTVNQPGADQIFDVVSSLVDVVSGDL